MNWETLFHWAAQVGGYGAIFLGGLGLICIAFAPKPQDPAECVPESPALPKPIRKAMATRDRLSRDLGLREKRKAWARDQDLEAEIHDLIGDVRERGDR